MKRILLGRRRGLILADLLVVVGLIPLLFVVIVACNRQQFFAGLEKRRLSALFEESLNRRAGLFGAAAGAPLRGRHETGL